MRGWPIARIAFYGLSLTQATKVVVGIVPSEDAEARELRDWKVDVGDVRWALSNLLKTAHLRAIIKPIPAISGLCNFDRALSRQGPNRKFLLDSNF